MATFYWLVEEDGELRTITFEGYEAGWAYVPTESGNVYYNVYVTDASEIVIKEESAAGATFYKYNSGAEAAEAGWRHILESELIRDGLRIIKETRERNARARAEWLKQIEEYKAKV
jgi:hypothetical protein